jgi:hypothetical protein
MVEALPKDERYSLEKYKFASNRTVSSAPGKHKIIQKHPKQAKNIEDGSE